MTRRLYLAAVLLMSAAAVRPSMNSAAGTVDLTRASPMTLHQNMRRLWTDHVVWTRQFIVATVDNDGSATVALNRLMRNQDDIGNAIKPFYGDAAGAKLTDLLKQHIAIAGDLLTAAKAGDATKKADADKR